MAIIYTYPRLTNPDGTELIVVSETKNQNATRLLTVGDICDFCDGPGAGCENSFLTVTTTSVTPAIALGCEDGLILESSDASITITNVGNTIDLTTVGGGGGCPPTYIIKPVCCEGEGECVVLDNIDYWYYTCDETLGALAPGYISNLQFNGEPITNPCSEEDSCWYIEVLSITADSTTCEVCCAPPSLVYKLTPCEEGVTWYTDDDNSSGPAGTTISNYDGQVIYATTPEGDNCYTVSQESGSPISNITVLIPNYEDCTCCLTYPLVAEYWECQGDPPTVHNILLTQGQIDDILTLGPASVWNTIRILVGEEYVCAYFRNMACEEADQVTWDNLPVDCYDQTYCPLANILLDPCQGNDAAHQSIIITDETESPTLAGIPDGNMISIVTGSGPACYTINRPWNAAISGGPVTVDENYTLSDECLCCTDGIMEYQECDQGPMHYFDITAFGFSNANPPQCLKAEFITEEYTCLEFSECVAYQTPEVPLTLVDNEPDCCEDEDCQEGEGTIRYKMCEQCEGQDPPGSMNTWVYFDDGGDPGSMPEYIIVTENIAGGQTWCYYKDLLDSQPEDPNYSYVLKLYPYPEEDCCPCMVFEYHDCDVPGTPLYTNNPIIMDVGLGGSWITGDGQCYETDGPVMLPQPDLFISEITPTGTYLDCDCCDNTPTDINIHQYVLCEYDPSVPGAPATLYIDISAYYPANPVGSHPDVISVDLGLGTDICYEWDAQVCEEPDYVYQATYDSCEECQTANQYEVIVELQSCDSAYTEKMVISDFSPDISGQVAGDVIEVTSGPLSALARCWEILDMNTTGPVTQTGPGSIWTIQTATGAGLDECECCEQIVRLYTICDAGASCDANAEPALYVDLSSIYPSLPGTILATSTIVGPSFGIQCCYEINEDPGCVAPTGTYDATVVDCDDAQCNIV